MMYASAAGRDAPDGSAWPLLTEKLVTVLAGYAAQQVEAGADCIQIFDSWVGSLSVADYRQFVLPATTELVRRVQALGVPVIYFGVDTASLLPAMRRSVLSLRRHRLLPLLPANQARHSIFHHAISYGRSRLFKMKTKIKIKTKTKTKKVPSWMCERVVLCLLMNYTK